MILSLIGFIIGIAIQPSVQIEITTFDKAGKPISGGSGVVIEKDTILTVAHVFGGAETAKATCNEKLIETEIVAYSNQLDLALIKYKEKCDIKPIKLANDNEPLASDLYLIGHPSQLPMMVTKGIVSSYSLELPSVRPLMWSDVKSWFGNSGGPAINSKGELIGISQALMAPFNLKIDNSGVDMDSQQYTILAPVSAIKMFLMAAKVDK